MPITIPAIVQTYVDTTNRLDTERFIGLFADNACVHDEGHYYCGIRAIREWLESTNKKYKFSMKPLIVKESGNDISMTAEMTGTFPGSPVKLQFDFAFHNNKITKLYIKS